MRRRSRKRVRVFAAAVGVEVIRTFVLSPRFLPTVLIFLDVLSSIRWGFDGNRSQTVYWFSAATLTYSVTWMKR